mmetsp:Transcript_50214/g.120822  ORF Transcript_50214/g.120822 Transcript_50214/m.120822 type:complete len:202 (+) Transcript_50214:76-681(+)
MSRCSLPRTSRPSRCGSARASAKRPNPTDQRWPPGHWFPPWHPQRSRSGGRTASTRTLAAKRRTNLRRFQPPIRRQACTRPSLPTTREGPPRSALPARLRRARPAARARRPARPASPTRSKTSWHGNARRRRRPPPPTRTPRSSRRPEELLSSRCSVRSSRRRAARRDLSASAPSPTAGTRHLARALLGRARRWHHRVAPS